MDSEMFPRFFLKTALPAAACLMCAVARADDPEAAFIRNQQRQEQLDRQFAPSADVRLDKAAVAEPDFTFGEGEVPCVRVNEILLDGEGGRRFAFVVPEIIRKSGFRAGMCLGSGSVQHLQKLAQNAVIGAGYITTQAVIEPQDLGEGRLKITVRPGRAGALRYRENNGEASSAGRVSAFPNKFPVKTGDVLNLRDLEQGLENLRRLPSVEADIRIEPAEAEGYSDIAVDWQQAKPVRFSIGADDSGSKATGKYQGTAAVFFDNPLGLSDLFYVSYSRDLGHKAAFTDSEGIRTGSGSRAYSLHYSAPFGKWLLAFNHNGYRYHEAAEGFYSNYDFNGKSYNSSLSASRVLWRNARHKTVATGRLWGRQVYRYIDDNELDVHRRRTAGWAADLRHSARLGRFTLSGGLEYKRGTGMRRSLPAPEEFNTDDGSVPGASRMKVVTADLGVAAPFQIGRQLFSADSEIRAQWNKTPLTPQDKLSIGGRYTVRGFDGENSLMGERGWYWQNNLNWHFLQSHQLYVGLDGGRVSGRSTEGLAKQRLVGTVLGVKGSRKIGGMLDYDLFAGKPLSRPEGFKSDSPVYGFNVRYGF